MQIVSEKELGEIFELLKVTPSEKLETERVEFKNYASEKSIHGCKDLPCEISALANKSGGIVVVGVKDSSDISNREWNKQLSGAPKADLLNIQERLNGKMKPKLSLEVYPFIFEEKKYIIINVQKSINSLVSTSSGKYYIRDGRSSRPMEPNEVQEHVKSLQNYDWSSEVLDFSASDALDYDVVYDAMKEYKERRGINNDLTVEGFLESIGATRNGMLVKGGLLFFGKKEWIKKIGNFEYRYSRRTKRGVLHKNEVWSDCIWLSIRIAKSYFDSCNYEVKIQYNDKEYKAPQLDGQAFHEAFLNAIVHRDYGIDGMVSVNHYDDRVVISSPGKFYGGVNSENIAIHEPRHRNKHLATLLMQYQLVDRAGMGVTRMGIQSLMYGRSFPKFIEREDCIEVEMETEYLRPIIFIMSQDARLDLGIVDLYILNSVYEVGYISAELLESQLKKISRNPWADILSSVDKLDCIEFLGCKYGIYLKVGDVDCNSFAVTKTTRTWTASLKYINLYLYLKKHSRASNSDLTKILKHGSSSQTSAFLKNAEFLKRSGSGTKSRWSLVKRDSAPPLP